MENWIDDLPICTKSGVGFQSNQKYYRQGGGRREIHEREDRCFNLKIPNTNTCLYAVFDGHEGSSVSHYAAQKIPAELILDRNMADLSETETKEALRNAFKSVERGFFELIDENLVKRTNLQIQIPEGLNYHETYDRYPSLVIRLQELARDIQGGTSATVVLLQNDGLYVSNVGDTRALLCTKDAAGGFHYEQLTVDHDITNEEELQRLANIGLDIVFLQKTGGVADLETTRSLGDFRVKGGYKEYECLQAATSEPVVSEPAIRGKIPILPSFNFLVIFTRGFYKALEEISGAEDVNKDIIALIAAEVGEQSSVEAAAQAVVDKVSRAHQDEFTQSNGTRCQEREDMTLLIRLFSAKVRQKSTPVTPPIPVSGGIVSRHSGSASPDVMPVSIPYNERNKLKPLLVKLPPLIMPGMKHVTTLSHSLSQPSSRVSTPVTLSLTAKTPPVNFYRNLSHVSEASHISTSSASSTTTSLSSSTDPATLESGGIDSSASSSRASSPWSKTIKQSPCTAENMKAFDGLLTIPPNPISVQVLSDSEEEEDGEAETPLPGQKPAEEKASEPPPDDGKVDPYIDFSDFIEKINREGGEEVVFAEFMP